MEQREQQQVLVGFDRLGRRLFAALNPNTFLTQRAVKALLAILTVTWLPTAVLSMLEGTFYDGTVYSFLLNTDAQVRLVIALPIAFLSLPMIRSGCEVVTRYATRNLVPEAQLHETWLPTVDRVSSLESSRWVPIILLIIVVMLAAIVMIDAAAAVRGNEHLWYAYAGVDGARFTWSGLWYYAVAVPVYQFITLRVFWTYLLWVWQLWKLSRTDLQISAAHGDRMGGLSILLDGQFGFLIFMSSLTSNMAGILAFEILDGRIAFEVARMEMLIAVLISLVILLAPLMFFVNDLIDERRRALIDFATLSTRFSKNYHQQWIDGQQSATENGEVVDASFIANFNSVYNVASSIKLIPITFRAAFYSFILLASPWVIVVFTRFSPTQLLGRIIDLFT